MGHDAILGTQQFTDIQVVDRTHPAIIRGKSFRQDGFELPRGKVVAKDKNGDMAPYEPALADAVVWAATTTIAVGDLKLPTVGNDHYYRCTTAGDTDAAEPTWPTTVGGTVPDGTVVWEEAGIIGVDDLAGGGVLTEVIDTSGEEVGAVLVHGGVVAENLDVAGAAATAVDIEALEAIGVYAI
jgi:hypothetical protein